ncbi:hypothetical protein I7I50_05382 [Histoplasma capsulatum G186AR]|uniref:Uncharacterized protein n=1 Tax=Ajellomyces capsulatus TaxID=5037 RepID=A0A8H7ZC95_AJECA|nr:hypothetical protein I7I52_03643 [Histoplasma capsulatum]QSS76058.1 hypothetical protein I7I50_05382 [Histoplasma capsulatum G186AR]
MYWLWVVFPSPRQSSRPRPPLTPFPLYVFQGEAKCKCAAYVATVRIHSHRCLRVKISFISRAIFPPAIDLGRCAFRGVE